MSHTPICYIAGSLPLPPKCTLTLSPDDLLIAADGGHLYLEERGVTPHIVVGDFDSSTPPHHPNVIRLPIEKDDTDMGYAIKLALSQGYKNFALLGGLGGLLDHTLANLQQLHALSLQNCQAILVGDSQRATVLTQDSRTLSGIPGDRCSVFAWGGEVQGLTLQNLHYSVENAPLSPTFPLGVSNSFTQHPATITVQQGSVLIIWEAEETAPISTFFTLKEGL